MPRRPDDPVHGTEAGYRRHHRARTAPCVECRWAHARYERRRGEPVDAHHESDNWYDNTWPHRSWRPSGEG